MRVEVCGEELPGALRVEGGRTKVAVLVARLDGTPTPGAIVLEVIFGCVALVG